jgi:phosphate-selective porin OprO and OprP
VRASIVVAAFIAATPLPALAASSGEELEQRLKIVERKLEVQKEDADAKAKETAGASAGEKGFGIRNADGTFELKLRGLLQADGRFFVGDPAGQGLNDTFTFRRIEPVFEVTLGKLVFFKLQPQFAGDGASTADAYGELRFAPAFGLRVGKFKEPLVLENLQPASALEFNERGFPTELGANRDLGAQFQGELFGGTTSYAVGVFNGAPDGRDAVASDTDSRKEGAARLFFEPFKAEPGFFQGLGFGIAGSTGEKLNAIGATTAAATSAANYNNTLPRYRSPGQNTVFSYRLSTATAPTAADTVVASGAHTRYTPQLYFYRGSFGLLGEYIVSKQEVAIGGVTAALEHRAYQGVASVVLTGEDAGFKGPAKPNHPYTPGGEGWGALEVAARYGVLDLDDDAFPVYADPARAVSEARDAGVALNWYLTANVRISADYDETQFTGGAAGGDRDREQAVIARLQLSY